MSKYKEYQSCANCVNAVRVNIALGNIPLDVWCGKHNTNFLPNSKCDYWERNTELGELLKPNNL